VSLACWGGDWLVFEEVGSSLKYLKTIVTNSTEFTTTSTLLAPRKRRKDKFSRIFPVVETFSFNRSLPNFLIYKKYFPQFFSVLEIGLDLCHHCNNHFTYSCTVHSRFYLLERERLAGGNSRIRRSTHAASVAKSRIYIYLGRIFLSFSDTGKSLPDIKENF
jgi:hypothetical protein